MSYTNHSSLVDLLRSRAETHPQRIAFTFLRKGSEESSLTYEELDQEARVIASLLQAEASPEARALLLYPSGREFIPAFLGCLYAGVVAVPTYPPDPFPSIVEQLQPYRGPSHTPLFQTVFVIRAYRFKFRVIRVLTFWCFLCLFSFVPLWDL